MGEIGAIKVRPHDPRSTGSLPVKLAADLEEAKILVSSRNGTGRAQTGRPMTGMAATYGEKGLNRAVHEVRAIATVDVQINESRREIGSTEIDYVC
jgi:hypothetical protein